MNIDIDMLRDPLLSSPSTQFLQTLRPYVFLSLKFPSASIITFTPSLSPPFVEVLLSSSLIQPKAVHLSPPMQLQFAATSVLYVCAMPLTANLTSNSVSMSW